MGRAPDTVNLESPFKFKAGRGMVTPCEILTFRKEEGRRCVGYLYTPSTDAYSLTDRQGRFEIRGVPADSRRLFLFHPAVGVIYHRRFEDEQKRTSGMWIHVNFADVPDDYRLVIDGAKYPNKFVENKK
jgi:hypothetical protein